MAIKYDKKVNSFNSCAYNKKTQSYPRRLVSTPHLRNKESNNWISWRPAEIHYIFNLQGLLVNERKGLGLIHREYIFSHPCKVFIISSTTPPVKTVTVMNYCIRHQADANIIA